MQYSNEKNCDWCVNPSLPNWYCRKCNESFKELTPFLAVRHCSEVSKKPDWLPMQLARTSDTNPDLWPLIIQINRIIAYLENQAQ